MKTRSPALVQLRKSLEEQRAAAFEGAIKLAPKADKDPAVFEEFEFALDRVMNLDQRLERFSNIHVTEPDLHQPGIGPSFLSDLAAVATHSATMMAAQYRLQRHSEYQGGGRAVRQLIEAQSRGVIFSPDVEQRALSLTPVQGSEFSPPDFMLEEFGSIARSASPVLRALPSAPLPPGCQEIYVPRVTSAGGVVVQQYENIDSPTTWTATDQITVAIAMFSGQVPLSQALFERGPNIDRYLTQDFAEAFAAAAEQQVIAGTGANGQILGLLNLQTTQVDGVPGANLVTYTSSNPTPAGVIVNMGQAAAVVGNTRLRPPSVAIMTPERYFWLAATPDSSGNEPTQRPGTGTVPSNADQGEYGPIAGLPCLLSGEVPQDLGAGGNQDTVIVTRTADLLWLPSDPVFTAYIDTSGGAEQMTVYASWHAYGALVSARHPSGTGFVQGTGMARSSLAWWAGSAQA